MKKSKWIWPVIILLNTAGLISLFAYVQKSKTKVGYVEITRLYDEFEMKKEYDQTFQQTESMRKYQMDSLIVDLNRMAEVINTSAKSETGLLEEYTFKKGECLRMQQEYEESNELLKEKYMNEIFGQINQYIKEYGEANGYDIIYGTAGNGNIMHANGELDLTASLIEYSNKKYQGGTE